MFEHDIEELKQRGLCRVILARHSEQGPVISIGGKKYVNFSSNDYLGLAHAPELARAAIKAMEKYGFGAGASRLLAGGTVLHERLERKLAEWKGTEAAVLFNSGHAANIGIIPAISSAGDVIFSDELNHASIIDGCRLSRARTVTFRHKDTQHLEELLTKEKGKRKIVITDSVFSMDGDIAPLSDIYDLCRAFNSSRSGRNSLLFYLDDAHGTGVLGKGRGALAHFGIGTEPWIIQMGTCSKALGSFGAFAAGSRDVIQWLTNSARSLLFSTALPPSVIAATASALLLIRRNPCLIDALWAKRKTLLTGLQEIGYAVTGSGTPIIPIMASSIDEAVSISRFLFERGIYAPAIRPPTVKEPRIRLVVTACHEDIHLQKITGALKMWRKNNP